MEVFSISSFDDKALLTFEIDKYYFHYANRIQRSQNIGKVKNSILTSVKVAILANTLNEIISWLFWPLFDALNNALFDALNNYNFIVHLGYTILYAEY